jgi:6-pyruvoyltetrahydropterin/6-carboxytetrahydropterin synthase
MTYRSTKTYGHDIGLSVAFRQWKATSHCRFMHGYALSVRVEFEANSLDERNWVIDFGSLKDFKARLQDTFDHKTVVATDDPYLELMRELHAQQVIDMVVVPATGCEAFARLVAGMATEWLRDHDHLLRVRVASVEVKEHGANSAIYEGPV